MIATNQASIKRMRARLAANEIKKVYVARVRGDFTVFRTTVNAPIGECHVRKQSNTVLYGVDHSENGRHARTEFVKRRYDAASHTSIVE